MNRAQKLLFLLAVILPGKCSIPIGGQAEIQRPCQCVNYNNEYMNCSCCPEDVSTDYAFRIDYEIVGSTSSPQTCKKEWASDPAIRCDCLFCGVIRNRRHPKYKVCKDLPLGQRPFRNLSNYVLNVTGNKGGLISNTQQNINVGESILKPAPVHDVEASSHLASNGKIIIELKWQPHFRMNFSNLKYSISWKKLEESTTQSALTRERNFTVSDVEPNSMYEFEIRCRPVLEGYWSDVAIVSVLTAAKCFERAPILVNYKADYSQCHGASDDECVQITVFWQRPPDLHWDSCTNYLLEITSSFERSQPASCDDVKAVIANVSYGPVLNLSIHTTSGNCTSPRSHLIVETSLNKSEPKNNILDARVIRIEQNSSVIIVIPRPSEAQVPDQYGVFYCKKGNDFKCEGDVTEVRIARQKGVVTVFHMEDPGPGYLFNVAAYWAGFTKGLSAEWLCPFSYCGKLYEPEITQVGVTAESMTLKVHERQTDPMCSSQVNRGLPSHYVLRIPLNSGEEFTRTLNGYGPFYVKVPSLSPNTTYQVTIKSYGNCGKGVAQSTDKFTTVVKGGQTLWMAIVAIAFCAIFILVIVVCFIRKRRAETKRQLETGTRQSVKALSVVSASTNGYTKAWLRSLPINGYSDYAGCKAVPLDYEEVREPNKDDEQCPEILAKCQKKWKYMLCCSSQPSVRNQQYRHVGNGQATLLCDSQPQTALVSPVSDEGNSASLTQLTRIELDNISKEPKSDGDSGWVQESSGEKRPDLETNPGNEETNFQVEVKTSLRESSPVHDIDKILDVIRPKNPVPSVNSSDSPSELNRGTSHENVKHVNYNPEANGSGLPSYSQFAGDNENQKFLVNNDYQEWEVDSISIDERLDNVTSSDDDLSTDQSVPFDEVHKIPKLPGSAINRLLV